MKSDTASLLCPRQCSDALAPRFFAFVIVLVLVGVFGGEAEAQIPPFQVQLLGVGGSDISGLNPGGELQANASFKGIGLALGLGGEALADDGGDYGGAGYLHLAIQLRPLMFLAALRERHRPVFHIFDPHADVGGTFGGFGRSSEAMIRGVFYVGAALDFGIPTGQYWMASQILITLGYRYVPVQTPSGPEHHLRFGLGWRWGL